MICIIIWHFIIIPRVKIIINIFNYKDMFTQHKDDDNKYVAMNDMEGGAPEPTGAAPQGWQ